MADKKKYEEVLNSILGTNIKWSKLAKEELAELATLLNNPEVLMKRLKVEKTYERGLIRQRLVEGAADIGEEWITTWDGPLARLARRVMKYDTEGKKEESKKEDLDKLVKE